MKFPRTSIAVSSAAPAISTFAATLIEAHTLSLFPESDQACTPVQPYALDRIIYSYHIGLLHGIQGKKTSLPAFAVHLKTCQGRTGKTTPIVRPHVSVPYFKNFSRSLAVE